MKRYGAFVILLFTTFSLTAQLRDIPSAVTNSLKAKYPSAADVSWEDNVTSFEANFKLNGLPHQARFNKDGTWKETERSLTMNELPPQVRSAFRNSKFVNWDLRTIAYIEKNNGGGEYRIFVRNKVVKRKYLFYNKEGKFIRESFKI